MKNNTKLLLFLMVLFFSATLFFAVIYADLYEIDNIENTLEVLGSWAPIAFVLLCAFRSFMLLPCGLFSVAGGFLFGPFKGTLLTLLGFTLNALVMFYMANYFGRDWVKRILRNKFDSIDEFVSKNGFSSFLLLRVVPLLPFDAVSCLGGISKAKLNHYLLASAIGSIPGVFIYTYFGDSIKTLSLEKILLPGVLVIAMSFVPLLFNLAKHKYFLKKSENKHSKTTI